MERQPDYKFYPSLLDAYNWYASSEKDESEQDFINKINRLRFESEAADKGTWFNELVDNALVGLEKYKLNYSASPVREIVERLSGAAKQLYVTTHLEVDGNLIELYGYLDYLKEDTVIDLKTTKQYELGKYKDSLQLHFYPVALIDSGNEINTFEFLVFDFDNVFKETYQVNYDNSKRALEDSCRNLIRFLTYKKDLITDTKIFGGEK